MLRKTCLTCLLLLALALPACNGPAPTAPPESRAAKLSELKNVVESRPSSDADWQAAVDGAQVAAGGGVKTGDDSRVRLDISDGTILRLAPQTEFELKMFSPEAADPVTQFTLVAGKMWVAVTAALGGGSFDVETPVGVATVRGSFMSIEYYPGNGQMIASCLEGLCRLTSSATSNFTDLKTGEQAGIPGFGQDPTPPKLIDIAQIQDWAAEFPEAASHVATITPGPQPTPTQGGTPPAGGGNAGGTVAGQTACDHPYFPLRAGATWTYSTPDGPMTWTVDSVSGDTTSAAAVMIADVSSVQITYHWQCDANGLVSYDFGSLSGGGLGQFAAFEVLGSSGVWLPAAELLAPGYSWSHSYQLKMTIIAEGQTLDGTSENLRDSTVVGAEPVAVGGQTYNGLQVSGASASVIQVQFPGVEVPATTANSTFTLALAQGVGLVSSSSTGDGETYSYELVSFSVP
jgi:hypothetical protein